MRQHKLSWLLGGMVWSLRCRHRPEGRAFRLWWFCKSAVRAMRQHKLSCLLGGMAWSLRRHHRPVGRAIRLWWFCKSAVRVMRQHKLSWLLGGMVWSLRCCHQPVGRAFRFCKSAVRVMRQHKLSWLLGGMVWSLRCRHRPVGRACDWWCGLMHVKTHSCMPAHFVATPWFQVRCATTDLRITPKRELYCLLYDFFKFTELLKFGEVVIDTMCASYDVWFDRAWMKRQTIPVVCADAVMNAWVLGKIWSASSTSRGQNAHLMMMTWIGRASKFKFEDASGTHGCKKWFIINNRFYRPFDNKTCEDWTRS